MPEIQANFASILNEVLHKKQFGLVRRGRTLFPRNYHRVLKNGQGLNRIDAMYSTLPTYYPEIFKEK